MTLLLDVTKARPYDPVALRTALRRAGLADSLTVTPLPRSEPRMRLHNWNLGDGSALLRLESTGIAAARSAPRPGAGPAARMAVAVLSPGDWTLTQHGRTVAAPPEEPALVAVDDAAPFDFRRTCSGTVLALHFDPARLMLPAPTLTRAVRGLRPDNSLYGLVRTFIQQLATVASTSADILPELNTTSMELVRALLTNAAEDAADPPARADPVRAIRRFVDEHLDDPDLCAESIAVAHNISPRQLYKLWSHTGIGLADYIIGRRLDRARDTLRTHRHLTITAVAHRHGFSDPTHFARRFRAAFAMTPSQWRAARPTR
ncbi:helix-turn-helix domain-containing protein [Nocardia bovistercoris]|uniref:Helix-turn-helix domain-containing protein n=1 Tax=Nocardia bovistercoris TaxID=2785916 RepID=A0A931N6C6_9NOCA|nr:helix-turn-helix domain-containing protein [Nocardia bovistercoris]MBH0780814.1 helix-turn-helix domain-containing protein [Nocardia bovistercoris]